ncbi:MAG: citrate synthase [Bacteriovoracaceae bacterium]|nr:citrate synthase [Bacteriovoracaceae bacterium]
MTSTVTTTTTNLSTNKAKIEFEGKTFEFPVVTGTEGERAIDITELRAKSGLITMDNGLMNTGSCFSSITYLDGDLGTLKYRGIPIEVLAAKSTFTEIAYLLVYTKLPTKKELTSFEERIASYDTIPDGIINLLKSFPADAHPMASMSAATVALSGYYTEFAEKIPKGEALEILIAQMLGQFKIMTAACYRIRKNLPLVKSDKKLSYCGDFLNMMFSRDGKANIDPEVIKALDVLLMLHADHEQNCSTATVRMVGSAQSNIFASAAAGINALWGPLHGGANQKVIEMLEMIHKDGGGYKKFIAKAKDKSDSFLLMGFGHRVYKNFDPRATIIKKACDTVLQKLGIKDPLLDIAKGLEEEALKDSYFVERKLYPNVDFYSGIIYRALGIPTEMFTVMFALGRMPGWLAQWKEQSESPVNRIARPRQIFNGHVNQEYTSIETRNS